jgi:hypothetical protein
VFQVGFAGLSLSSQHLLLQLEAVYDLLQSLSTSSASQDIVTQELSGPDMKVAESQSPEKAVSQDVEDQLEAEDMPEDEKKEAAEQNNEAKTEATAPTPLPDLVTCHQPLVAPVAIASGPSCHANELNHRLPDLVLSGLRRPPEERNVFADRPAVIINSDDSSVGNDAAATAANTRERCLRPPVGRLSSHPVLPAALAAKSRRRRSFRIGGHPAERHGAAAGGTDVLRAGGEYHRPLLRRAVVWRQAGAELATIADSLMAASGGSRRLVVAVANPRQLAAANQRINSEEEEEESMEDVMMDSWEGLLLAVMARTVLYACLSRLKRLLF